MNAMRVCPLHYVAISKGLFVNNESVFFIYLFFKFSNTHAFYFWKLLRGSADSVFCCGSEVAVEVYLSGLSNELGWFRKF